VVTFFSIIAIILLLSLLFLVLKPRKKTKTKAQKQEEIREMYRQKLKTGLANIQNTETRQKRKLVLLKAYAKELEFNLFFDKDEVKVLMEELASY